MDAVHGARLRPPATKGETMGSRSAALLLAATALAPLPAFAQQTAAPPAGNTVQEVVVTAQRRSERLQDVPVSITALSSATLASANVTDLRQLVQVTPSLRMDQTGTFTQPTIRGVGSAVTGPGADSNVGLYVDGFYQPSMLGADFDLTNISSVEVLKGPQGTLFGRNATGGAILINTLDPSTTPQGTADFSYRTFNDKRGELYLSGPITDTLSANLSAYGRSSDGFKTDILTGLKDAPVKTFNLRGKLLWKPTDKLRFLLTYSHIDLTDPIAAAYSTFDNNSIGNAIPGAIVARSRFDTAMVDPPQNHSVADGVYLKASYDMDWATLTSWTGYRREADKEQSELDRWETPSRVPTFTATWDQRETTVTQEINLSNSKGPFNWVAGLYYYYDKGAFPFFNFNSGGNIFDAGGDSGVTTNAYAAYADGTYEVVPKLFITGGIRYSDEQQRLFWIGQGGAPDGGTGATSHTWTSVNERANIRYELAPNTNAYFSYSNGFKSGVYNVLPIQTTPINQEGINAYEVGFKTAQSNWRWDVAAYYYQYSNLQFTAYKFIADVGSVSELSNAKAAIIYGLESQLTYNFTPDLDIRLGGAWTHARYDDYANAVLYIPTQIAPGVFAGNGQAPSAAFPNDPNAKGKTMVRAPDFTLTAGADYTRELPYGRMRLSGNLYFSSKVYFDPHDTTWQNDYATLDLKATWISPGDQWSFSVFGDNITDTKYVTQVAEDVFGYGAIYGTPATVGVEATTKF
jgi:iron complex outermembrane receptor protein